MLIYNNLKGVKKLSNSSISAIIDVTNLNFKRISDANLEFLRNINYDEVMNSISLNIATFNEIYVTTSIEVGSNNIPAFKIDSNGIAEGKELLVELSEAKRRRFTDFNDWPDVGIPGEVIYTGIQNNKPEFGEDFIGYLDSRGWVSLTGENSGGGTVFKYTNLNPMPEPVGGYDIGDTFLNKTNKEMWDGLLYPYQFPTFLSFYADYTTTVEVGYAHISDVHSFTWATSNSGNLVANSVSISGAGITTVSGLSDNGTEDILVSELVRSSPGSKSWSVSAINTKGDSLSRVFSIKWLYKMNWGTFSNKTMTQSDIDGLVSKGFASNRTGTKHFNAVDDEYKIIVYPKSFGIATNFIDVDTGFAVSFDSPVTQSYTNAEGITYDVYLYTSTYMLGGEMNIRVY